MTAVEGLRALLPFLDYASVAVFALTGALVASRAQLDVVGFIFIACLTATGGGTLRDVMLDRDVFWIVDPWMLGVASLAAVGVFLTAHRLESRYQAILWLDAFALAVAVPAGVAAAMALGRLQGLSGSAQPSSMGVGARLPWVKPPYRVTAGCSCQAKPSAGFSLR